MPLRGTLLSLPQKCSKGRWHRGPQPTWVVTKLVRIVTPKARRKAGSAKGLITMASDFDAPLEDFRAYMQ